MTNEERIEYGLRLLVKLNESHDFAKKVLAEDPDHKEWAPMLDEIQKSLKLIRNTLLLLGHDAEAV